MNKLLVSLALLLLPLTSFAQVNHWICSNEESVLYFILDTDEGNFMMFDDKGGFLAASKFTSQEKTKDGTPFLYGEVSDKLAVGVTRDGDYLVLALAHEKGTAKFVCQ
jgi:hypothetical protein